MQTRRLGPEEGFPSQKAHCRVVTIHSAARCSLFEPWEPWVLLGVGKDRGFPAATPTYPPALSSAQAEGPSGPPKDVHMGWICCVAGKAYSPSPALTNTANWGEGAQYRGAEASFMVSRVSCQQPAGNPIPKRGFDAFQ